MRPGVITIVFGATLMGLVLGGQEPGTRPGYTGVTPDRPIKCGWSAHPELLRARIAAPQARPERQVKYISASGAFAVNYDTSGQHAPDLADDNGDGEPDWVVEVAAALDSARNLLLALGFDPAPADDDGIYDVYLQEYNGDTYGLTVPDGSDVQDRIISYMLMDNDFAEDEYYYTHGIDAARVTAAHEYFHAVQMGYKPAYSDVFLYELSSTWFEDVTFPEVNDWVYWFKEGSETFGKKPTQPMAGSDGYSIAIFGHYLAHITGIYRPDIMRQTWERFKSTGATAAIEYGLTSSYGGNLTVAWTDFVARLFLNGRAPDPGLYFYADQDLLDAPDPGTPEILVDNLSLPFNNLRPGTAGIRALELAGPANLRLQIVSEPTTYGGRVVVDRDGNYLTLNNLTSNAWHIAGLSSLSRVVVVVGGERDSVVVTVTATDTLTHLAFSLDYLAPNPLIINKPAHREITLGYTVGKALPGGDHRIVIYNLLGQELYRQRIMRTVGEGSHTLYLSTLPFLTWASGVYILHFTVDQRNTFTRTFTLLR